MKKHIIIFEAQGGSDKGEYGFRKDSKPIIDSLKNRGWNAEIIFYCDENRGEIYRHTIEKADAYISRVNPGNLKDETGYFQMLRELVKNGVEGLPHPDAMLTYGAKNAVEKLKTTGLVPDDVFTYYDFETFKNEFPKTLTKGVRVIKQNRGSTGEGIWRVEVKEKKNKEKDFVSMDSILKLTEAKDNHVEEKTLRDFIDFCVQYLEGANGMILDMPFLERIKEGEIRVLMLRDKIVNIVHKKPASKKDAFSATLFSGAKYRYDSPDKWPALVKIVKKNLKSLQEGLGNYDLPLIWTVDFILDTNQDTGKDTYVLSEINASCVGFSTQLELSENIAEEIENLIEAEEIINRRWPAFKV